MECPVPNGLACRLAVFSAIGFCATTFGCTFVDRRIGSSVAAIPPVYPLGYWVCAFSVPVLITVWWLVASVRHAVGRLVLPPLALITITGGVLWNFGAFPHSGVVGWIFLYAATVLVTLWIHFHKEDMDYLQRPDIDPKLKLERVKGSVEFWRTLLAGFALGYAGVAVAWAQTAAGFLQWVTADKGQALLLNTFVDGGIVLYTVFVVGGPIYELFEKMRKTADLMLLVEVRDQAEFVSPIRYKERMPYVANKHRNFRHPLLASRWTAAARVCKREVMYRLRKAYKRMAFGQRSGECGAGAHSTPKRHKVSEWLIWLISLSNMAAFVVTISGTVFVDARINHPLFQHRDYPLGYWGTCFSPCIFALYFVLLKKLERPVLLAWLPPLCTQVFAMGVAVLFYGPERPHMAIVFWTFLYSLASALAVTFNLLPIPCDYLTDTSIDVRARIERAKDNVASWRSWHHGFMIGYMALAVSWTCGIWATSEKWLASKQDVFLVGQENHIMIMIFTVYVMVGLFRVLHLRADEASRLLSKIPSASLDRTAL